MKKLIAVALAGAALAGAALASATPAMAWSIWDLTPWGSHWSSL